MDRYVMDRGGVAALLNGSPKGANLMYTALTEREPTTHIALHRDALPLTHSDAGHLIMLRSVIECQPHRISVGQFPKWLILDPREMPFDPIIDRADMLYAVMAAEATGATILTGAEERVVYLKNNIHHIVI